MRKLIKMIFPVLFCLGGLAMLLYPWISNYLYENRADGEVSVYEKQVEKTDDSEKQEILKKAREYNNILTESKVQLTDPFDEEEAKDNGLDYNNILNVNGDGMMGFIDIPKINVYLPVYHGTSKVVLESGIGHLEESSLPVGGENTHVVLSGHTGLSTKKLFTDLTEIKEDDLFFLHILGDVLAYKVISVDVVEPEDTTLLSIQKGKDLATLVTCTPYGVNTHRLLVTGERTEYNEKVQEEADSEKAPTQSLWMKSYTKAITIGLCIVTGMIIFLLILTKLCRKIKPPKINDNNIPAGLLMGDISKDTSETDDHRKRKKRRKK